MELAKTWRNRLRRINQKAGGTEGKFLALMKEVVKGMRVEILRFC